MSTGLAMETAGLGKRYGRTWALRDCSLAVPAGHVVGLVGANGAGKTTLLSLAVGLATATTGQVRVAGGRPAGSAAALDAVAFVAQEAALYRNLSVADMLRMGRGMNRRWDADRAQDRLRELGIPVAKKVGALSGGQRSQVALTLALAKRPELLVLDEPLAALDPVARHDFMAALMTAVSQDGISVVFSSHVVSELERVCDYVVVVHGGRIQVCGEVEDLVAEHCVLTGPAEQAETVVQRFPVVQDRRAAAQAHLLARAPASSAAPAGWQRHPVGLEELLLAYMREPSASVLPGPQPLHGEQVVH
ncbi:ATP-binding cassette domain-containing protein [Streptomyces broussonetiae]|uniref:ATP-binding cassette domain-containing protein n=1 Tax=Streptomyces broussonetiae TaxID=2686304 RepID=A0A6I6MXR6_9ACTN|nr:ABC transporter ATP-binding protein [Streptomyces broussonetiae]QHA03039.1 ATP-binding cassette domain-containing protein [Streptomyces broussonetiae]